MSDEASSGALESRSSNNLVVLALEFDLPFALLVADGFGPRRKPDYTDFQFMAHDLPITLRFSRMMRTDKSTIIDLNRPQEGASHTRVQLWLDGAALEEQTGSSDFRGHAEDLIDLAMEVVNRYIVLYRELSGAFWLRAVTRRDIPEFAFVGVLQDGKKITLLYETGRQAGAPSPLSEAAESLLRERFAAAYDPDPLQSLALTVRDLFERGEHWQAAVAVTLLGDVKIARLLRGWFEARGDAAPWVRFLDEGGKPRASGELLRTCVPEIGDASLGSVVARWEETTQAFRAGLARGERSAIGEKEAGDAIVAVWGLLEELERAVGAGRKSDLLEGAEQG